MSSRLPIGGVCSTFRAATLCSTSSLMFDTYRSVRTVRPCIHAFEKEFALRSLFIIYGTFGLIRRTQL